LRSCPDVPNMIDPPGRLAMITGELAWRATQVDPREAVTAE